MMLARAIVAGAIAALAGHAAPAAADPAVPHVAKKDRAVQSKTAVHRAPPAPGTRPPRLVNLYNHWTREWLAVEAGALPPRTTLDRFLRDHFTNEPTAMEPRLVAALVGAAARFRSDVVQIVSAFRHPKYNLILRKKGRQVARDSQHSHGTAVDFTIPRVPPQALQRWARAQRLGGVGLYPASGFIHIDTGPIRTWSGE